MISLKKYFLLLVSVGLSIGLRYSDVKCFEDTAKQGTKKWMLIVSGSKGWQNYRHQADAAHAWHIAHEHGVPKENIVLMMYDDIAYHEKNVFKGQLFNKPKGVNVYGSIAVDYANDDVTADNFLKVLKGNTEALKNVGSGKVIESGPNDHVFVYIVSNGDKNLISFPDSVLTSNELNNAIINLSSKKRFGKMVIYVDCPYSGSMFENLPNNLNVYVTTSASSTEATTGCYCYEKDLPCLGDLFSVLWMEHSEKNDVNKVSLKEQFEYINEKVQQTSKIYTFGNKNISLMSIGNFIGEKNTGVRDKDTEVEVSGIFPVENYYLNYYIRDKLKYPEENFSSIVAAAQAMKHSLFLSEAIIDSVSPSNEHRQEIVKGLAKLESGTEECFHNVSNAFFHKTCFDSSIEKDAALGNAQRLINLCSANWTTQDAILHAVGHACSKLKLNTYERTHLDKELVGCCFIGDALFCRMSCSLREKKGVCSGPYCMCMDY